MTNIQRLFDLPNIYVINNVKILIMEDSLSARLLKIMKLYRMSTYADFADKVGLKHQTASNYIKGKQKPDLQKFTEIIQSFDEINTDWLLTGKGEMLKSSMKSNLEDYDKLEILNFIEDNEEDFLSTVEMQRFLKRMGMMNYISDIKNEIKELKKKISESTSKNGA